MPSLPGKGEGAARTAGSPGGVPVGWQQLFCSCKAARMAPSISHSWALPPGASRLPQEPWLSRLRTFPPLCCQDSSLHPLSLCGQLSCLPFLPHIAQYLPVPPLRDLHGVLSSAYKTSPSTAGQCHISAAPTGARGSASPTQVCVTHMCLHRPREFALPTWVCIACTGLHRSYGSASPTWVCIPYAVLRHPCRLASSTWICITHAVLHRPHPS